MKNLHKSRADRMFLGVCVGIGETLAINTIVVRAVFVMAGLLLRIPTLLLYMALGFMLPMGDAPAPPTRPSGYKPEDPPFDISDAQDVDFHNNDPE